MAEPKNANGETAAQDNGPEFQAQVVGQYIKDLSFESPNVTKLIDGPGESPNLNVQVNVNADKVGDDLFESAIEFKAVAANNKLGTIYDLELIYAGLFRIKKVPQDAMEPFLLVNCPALIFPFLRRIAADLTREGGFPPLLLDPIDFGALYMSRKQKGEVRPLQTN